MCLNGRIGDTVTDIVYAGSAEGDLILLCTEATNTITYDDANIALGGTTRACAPGGSILLVKNGAGVWTEIAFTATGDHA